MPVQIRNLQRLPVRRALVRRAARRMLAALDLADAELSIALVDDARMRALNHRYRRLDRATDVLAFPLTAAGDAAPGKRDRCGPVPFFWASRGKGTVPFGDSPCFPRLGPPVLLGDVVLSVETAARRAGTTRLHAELVRYLGHGLLHLCGWDHDTPPARRRMRRQERALWRVAWDDRP